ncbi:hypothetical protein [Sporomusa paucivorans]|uniref:hypothetical protein n=1 Tax=Sporomusa paucivorans TaxID=2376 RepID=UPI003570B9C8
MLKVMLSNALKNTFATLCFGGTFSWIANFAQITEINILKLLFDEKFRPYSYIIAGKFLLILFLLFLVKELLSERNRLKLYKKKCVDEAIKADCILLDEMAIIFSGNKIYNLINNLENIRTISVALTDQFDEGIRRFNADDKRLQNIILENNKKSFLSALKQFLDFSYSVFESKDGTTIRFYGVLFENNKEKYDMLVANLKQTWSDFQTSIREIVPNHIWKS